MPLQLKWLSYLTLRSFMDIMTLNKWLVLSNPYTSSYPQQRPVQYLRRKNKNLTMWFHFLTLSIFNSSLPNSWPSWTLGSSHCWHWVVGSHPLSVNERLSYLAGDPPITQQYMNLRLYTKISVYKVLQL
jgi:hypothetical protein